MAIMARSYRQCSASTKLAQIGSYTSHATLRYIYASSGQPETADNHQVLRAFSTMEKLIASAKV